MEEECASLKDFDTGLFCELTILESPVRPALDIINQAFEPFKNLPVGDSLGFLAELYIQQHLTQEIKSYHIWELDPLQLSD